MTFVRRAALFVLILWLPLQGIAAVAMPFCAHALGTHPVQGQFADLPPGHDHQHHQGSGPQSGQDPHAANQSPLGCSGCGACHLVCAPVVPIASTLALAPADSSYSPLEATLVRLFIPDQPQPPPNHHL